MQNLVIVESPTKAKTLAKFLGKDYEITASMGHIRDLPKSELGVDTEHNFEPKYIIPRDKKKKANELVKMALGAKTIWLASDPDREGEAIAWHIAQLLDNSNSRSSSKTGKRVTSNEQTIKRVVFHEITEEAIKDAFNHPREIDYQMVDAQQARRVLDRLVGYKLSPLLWQKVKKGLSAGRVQSVALRLIVEREREVEAFKPIEYWSIEVTVVARGSSLDNSFSEKTSSEQLANKFTVSLTEINGKKAEIGNETDAKTAVAFLEQADYQVAKVTKKEVKRNPYAPFITSTLQQASANKLGYSAKKTMSLAQGLYERGLITYMRTDSVNLATVAVDAARKFIQEKYGPSYLPAAAKVYKSKSKNAQEAHEAIRPTNVKVNSEEIPNIGDLNRDHARLYDLIWKRFMACQMVEALLDQTTIDVVARHSSLDNSASAEKTSNEQQATSYVLRATGSVIKFDGWLKLYGKKVADESEESNETEDGEKILPAVEQGQDLNKIQVLPEQHFTQPPPRFNEASLIKKLEELGIGRPSTYAPILSTLQDRYYVEKREKKLFPTTLGFAAIDFLVKYFADILDYAFTAKMEDELDEISRGERKWQPTIKEFYDPFEKKIILTGETAEKMQVITETTDRICPLCGKPLIVRIGKFGKFLACSGFPECKHTESLEEIIDAKCPDDGGNVILRRTKTGKPFFGCKNWPNCKWASWTKPKTENSNQSLRPDGLEQVTVDSSK